MADLFKAFNLFHAVIIIIAAIGFFYFWARTNFWFPRYIHIIAVSALLLGILMSTMVSKDAPIDKYGITAKLILIFIFPLIVYFAFIFYGGQKSAYESKFTKIIVCPYCGEEMVVNSCNTGTNGVKPVTAEKCENCGQEFRQNG